MLFVSAARTLSRSSLRASRVATRSYAEAAEKVLKLQFSLPHETLYAQTQVAQVNLPAQSGKMGILASHVPTIEQLAPGVVEVFEGATPSAAPKKYFISGGFATVQPDSVLSITAAEAFPLDSFSQENVRSLLQQAKAKLGDADETVAAEAAITVEVLEALESATK
ncbi:F1F0 ATP synthase subunit delta [Maudiozyma humilis]|uniref:ATP synthase subunit delta, mitochondrial n=1 Tax=Maudiozyma humilis TaxID=51915 RepID=A0AAV5S2T7_MAUHU|nr:F1F0 ATP synthase subunit delta [Kazachstania humilis]